MELRNLRCFVVVAEELNFGRAAARLHITQPGLSQRIKALERSLGVRLFERSRQRVALTSVGAGLLPEVRELLDQADRVQALSRYLCRGEHDILGLGHTRSAGVGVASELTAAFRQANPEIEVRTSMGFTAANVAAVTTGELDIAFVRAPANLPGEVASMTIDHDPIMVALPLGHRLLPADEVRVDDIAGEPLVFFPEETAPGMWHDVLRAIYGKDREPPIRRFEPDEALMLAAVAEGAGISLVTLAAGRMLEVPGVEIRPLLPRVAVALSLVWLRTNPSRAVARFVDCAREFTRGQS
jgi:DNA-binding transcriptional LysR family regulator